MRNNLKMLDELQEIDLKIDGLKGELRVLQDNTAALEAKLAEAESVIAAKNAQLEAVEEEKSSLEENLAAETDNILRSEARLKEIKTQKEYQAVSKEIATARKVKVELEEQVLQKINQAEEMKNEITSEEENLRALQQNVIAQRQELQVQIEKLDSAVAAEVTSRDAAVKTLPASIIKRYSILREQRRGVAVVEARDGYCLGCNMNLPPQLYNSLYRGDELITCPHCQRVLMLRQK